MKPILILSLGVLCAGPLAAQQADDAKSEREREAAFSRCVQLGVLPGSPEMKECVAAPSANERMQVADRAQYGTR